MSGRQNSEALGGRKAGHMTFLDRAIFIFYKCLDFQVYESLLIIQTNINLATPWKEGLY